MYTASLHLSLLGETHQKYLALPDCQIPRWEYESLLQPWAPGLVRDPDPNSHLQVRIRILKRLRSYEPLVYTVLCLRYVTNLYES